MATIAINMKEGALKNEQDIIVGIDLGTTNSLVAYIHNEKPVAVKGADGKNTLLPSIIHFAKDGSIVVGDEAKKQLVLAPHRTIYSVKRLLGKSYKDINQHGHLFSYQIIDEDQDSLVKIKVDEQFYSPIELSSYILKALKVRVEAELGKKISKVVITVPAYFNDSQRQATRDAGKLAGLDVLRIINEPTAASLAYGLDKNAAQGETVAVYDLGGGTFDVSILQIQDGIFEVLSTNGDTLLGGDDFDWAIIEYWLKQKNISRETLLGNQFLGQTLRLLAEEAKKYLSQNDYFERIVDAEKWSIHRSDFESLIQPLVQKTIVCCENALRDAKLQISDIQHIILVGGSTRVPLVREMLGNFFQKTPNTSLNPDEVVALGAAIQADVLAGNQKNVLLIDVTPLSLGIETVGGLMDTIIARNSKIPTKAARQYTTSVDGQKNLQVSIFQGERDLVLHNRKLGSFVLRNIPPMPAGLPKIDIQFLLDADGILRVSAKELRSGVAQSIEVKPQYGLSEEDMAKMLLDSIQHAEQDMQQRALLEARNEANNILLSSDKFLVQHKNLLSEVEITTFLQLKNELQHATQALDKDAIQQAMQTLNTFAEPLAHRAMDNIIGDAMKGHKI